MWRSHIHVPPDNPVESDAPFIKCHTSAGHVYVLSDWKIAPAFGTITGSGIHYDQSRRVVYQGDLIIPYRRVVLIEASQPESSFKGLKGIGLGVLTVLSLIATVLIAG
jgi:hypothetical protein